MPFPLPSSPSLRTATWTACITAALIGCGADDRALDARPADGQFGNPATPDSGLSDASVPSASDAGADNSGPTVMVRVAHAIPNAGPLMLCRFASLTIDDPSTAVDELDRTNDTGELVVDTGPLAEGLSFGDVSPWVRLPIAGTGLLSLHRVATPEALDAGIAADAGLGQGDAGNSDAASTNSDATVAPARPCDPATIEVALPLPLPADWLTPPALPPSGPPGVDAGLADAGLAPSDDAALPSLEEQLAARGIATSLNGASSVTLFASGLAFSPSALTKALSNDGGALIHAADLAFGPRLLASERPATPPGASFSLSLAHLVPDVLAGGSAPAALRACITVDGVEGRALPALSASPVAFRERVSLASELAVSSHYRIRVFAADDVSAPGQDCANTTRAPLALLDTKAAYFSAGVPYTLLVSGLTAPETVCAAAVGTGVARTGCFGTGDRKVQLIVLAD